MNLTITIDSELLKRARIRALEEDTSVNAVLREFLTDYANERNRQQQAIDDLLRLSQASCSKRGGKRWARDELYER